KQRVYIPVWAAMLLASFQELRKWLSPRFESEVTRYRVRRITTETTYDISRTIDELGYKPDNNTERQIQAIVDWYLEEKRKGFIK
ncbi:MAG: hypothetical protein AB1715_14405, partial [Acidobacteriota bacterium]